MRKIYMMIAAIFLCLSLTACSIPNPLMQNPDRESSTGSTAQAADTAGYHFESIDDEDVVDDSYQFMLLIAGYPVDYEEQCALIQGRLLTLLGKPLYESADYEYSYDYAVKATDGEGGVWYLSVYQGYYGPSIGTCGTGEEIPEVAYALYNEIMAASAADFEYEGYYTEIPSKILSGVENGKPYFYEEVITDPEEIQRMYDILGWDPGDLDSEEPEKL